MPLFFTEDAAVVALMGHGDIGVAISRVQGDQIPSCLTFMEIEPGEIGRLVVEPGITDPDGYILPGSGDDRVKLVLGFDDVASIDVVIESLEELRVLMKEGRACHS